MKFNYFLADLFLCVTTVKVVTSIQGSPSAFEKTLPVILTLMEKYGLKKEEIAYIGDDLIDLSVMKYAGISFSPKDAHCEALKAADVIISKRGGYGAVRVVIDMILKSKGIYNEIISKF